MIKLMFAVLLEYTETSPVPDTQPHAGKKTSEYLRCSAINNINKHKAELQRTGHKIYGRIQYQGLYFPPNTHNGFLLFPSFNLGKNTLK